MRRNMCMCMMCVLQFFSRVTVFTRRTWYPSVPPPGISSELQDPPISHSPTKGHGYKACEIHKITANETPVCSLFTARWQVRGSNAFWVLPVGENEHVQPKMFRIYKM